MPGNRSKSKKRSASSSQLPPDLPVAFFLDRSLGTIVVATALRAKGVVVHSHNDHFAPDAPDEEWLTAAGSHGWVVLTKDEKIRHRELERDALIHAQVRAFILVSGNLTGSQMAEAFVKALPKMLRFVAQHDPPFIAKVFRNGGVELFD